jgi:hypothetical protein
MFMSDLGKHFRLHILASCQLVSAQSFVSKTNGSTSQPGGTWLISTLNHLIFSKAKWLVVRLLGLPFHAPVWLTKPLSRAGVHVTGD